MADAERTIYCIDTSSLGYCQRSFGDRATKRTTFARVWEMMDRLAAEGRMQAPYLVSVEITRNNDFIGQWCQDRSGIFRPKGEHATRVVDILREPGQRLVDPAAPRGAEESDPWVIALAEGINAAPFTLFDEREVGVVVSEETKVGGIRDICGRRTVQHLDVSELLVVEQVFGSSG